MATSDTCGSRGRIAVRWAPAWPSPPAAGSPPAAQGHRRRLHLQMRGHPKGDRRLQDPGDRPSPGPGLEGLVQRRAGPDRAKPIVGGRRVVTAQGPPRGGDRQAESVDAYDHGARSPRTLRIVGAGQIHSGSFKLRKASARPRKSYYSASDGQGCATCSRTASPPMCGSTSSSAGRARWWTAGWSGPEPKMCSHGQMGRDPGRRGSRFATAATSSGSARRAGAWSRASDARFQYHRFKFPILGRHSYGDGIGAPGGPHPPGPGSLRPLHHSAGGGPRRPGAVEGLPLKRRLLPGHRRPQDRPRLRRTCT